MSWRDMGPGERAEFMADIWMLVIVAVAGVFTYLVAGDDIKKRIEYRNWMKECPNRLHTEAYCRHLWEMGNGE